MEEDLFLKAIELSLLGVSPVIFILGIVLIVYGNYQKLDAIFNKKIGGITKVTIPVLEKEIYTFNEWLLKKKIFLGIICVLIAIILFIVLKS